MVIFDGGSFEGSLSNGVRSQSLASFWWRSRRAVAVFAIWTDKWQRKNGVDLTLSIIYIPDVLLNLLRTLSASPTVCLVASVFNPPSSHYGFRWHFEGRNARQREENPTKYIPVFCYQIAMKAMLSRNWGSRFLCFVHASTHDTSVSEKAYWTFNRFSTNPGFITNFDLIQLRSTTRKVERPTHGHHFLPEQKTNHRSYTELVFGARSRLLKHKYPRNLSLNFVDTERTLQCLKAATKSASNWENNVEKP